MPDRPEMSLRLACSPVSVGLGGLGDAAADRQPRHGAVLLELRGEGGRRLLREARPGHHHRGARHLRAALVEVAAHQPEVLAEQEQCARRGLVAQPVDDHDLVRRPSPDRRPRPRRRARASPRRRWPPSPSGRCPVRPRWPTPGGPGPARRSWGSWWPRRRRRSWWSWRSPDRRRRRWPRTRGSACRRGR